MRFDAWKEKRCISSVAGRVVADLEAYYRKPIETVAQEYWRLRDKKPSQEPVDIEQHYQTTHQYIYESSYFEAYSDCQRQFEILRKACRQFKRSPVLDYGGGAGGVALSLSLAGIACDYADISGPTMDYARWRLKRHNAGSRVLDVTQTLPDAEYEAIVTIDVFEHLPDITATLRQLAKALKPGGWLISKSTFAPGDPMHLEQNLRYADMKLFNRLLQEVGFCYLGRLRPDVVSEYWYKWTGQPDVARLWLDKKLKFGGRFLVHQLAA